MNRKVISGVVAVVLAAVGTLALVTFVRGAEDRALAGERTVNVLVVAEAVNKGARAEDISGAVRTEKIPAKVQAAGSVESLDALAGKVAAVDLVKGEQIVAARFVEPAALQTASEVDVPEGLQEITVALAPERAVGGNVRPGDTVGVFASFNPFTLKGASAQGELEEKGETPNTTHLVFHKVLVTNVQAGPQEVLAPAQDDEDSLAPNPAPAGQILVTLAVDAGQAERIVFTAEYGTLWLSNEDANATEQGTKIRTRLDIYDR